MSNDAKKVEVSKYRQELAGYMEPFDKLTADDLLAEIVSNEAVEYCEKLMGGTVQHLCMNRESSSFKENPKAFVENFLRPKNDWTRSVYTKMAKEYLKAAEFYLDVIQDSNRYFQETSQIHENFQRCFNLISASEYLKLSPQVSTVLLEYTECVEREGL